MAKPSSDRNALDSSLTKACVQRLAAEFPGRIPVADIIAVVTKCQEDLAGQEPASALPELVERLARHRLVAVMDPGE